VRALLFDLQGNLLGKGKVELQAYYSTQPGWAEQDPEYYWAKLGEACQQLWAQTGIDRSQIAGVSLTTQRGTVINVDAEGKPLRPAILWLDQRQSDVEGGIKGRGAGCSNWSAHRPPWITFARRPRPTGSPGTSLKSGRRPTSFCCSRVSHPSPVWALCRLGGLLRRLPAVRLQTPEMGRAQRLEMAGAGGASGAIADLAQTWRNPRLHHRRSRRHTGIPEGLPLIAAGADKACEVVGSGVVDASTVCLSYGTTATITSTRSRYLEIVPLIPPYPRRCPISTTAR
jgi:hypothetical protein